MRVISVVICATFCMGNVIDDPPAKTNTTTLSIEGTIKKHSEELMSIPGVVGIGQGLCGNNSCIKVYVIKRTPELDKKIPGLIGGYEISIETTGEIRAHPDN